MAEKDTWESDLESETDDDHAGPASPPKRPKTSKMKGAAVYRTKFNKAWTKTYPFVHEVQGDMYSFHCAICKRHVSCSHMGRHDVERHIGKALHQANVKAARSQSTLPFQPLSSSLSEKVYFI